MNTFVIVCLGLTALTVDGYHLSGGNSTTWLPWRTTNTPWWYRTTPINCPYYQYRCANNRQCIYRSSLCNGYWDCNDGSDEQNCTTTTQSPTITMTALQCGYNQFSCHNSGQCVYSYQRCDGHSHCYDGSDEHDCPTTEKPEVTTYNPHCRYNQFRCNNGYQCIPHYQKCNGYSNCYDGSDEWNCQTSGSARTTPIYCSSWMTQCANNQQCIYRSSLCNGYRDCYDGSDEQNCTTTTTQSSTSPRCGYNQFACNNGWQCVYSYQRCDRSWHCNDGSDEWNCQTTESQSTASSYGGMRLAGGNGYSYGRVEININDRWGTICDDGFDIQDANVICRQLGFRYAMTARPRAYFGQGNGTIWLDDLQCGGYESSLLQCRHIGLGSHNCGHGEDAGVECSNDRNGWTSPGRADMTTASYEYCLRHWPCRNGATCVSYGNYDYRCVCPSYNRWYGREVYHGRNCENREMATTRQQQEMTTGSYGYCERNGNPCYNGGTCVSQGYYGYHCNCPSYGQWGYSGRQCRYWRQQYTTYEPAMSSPGYRNIDVKCSSENIEVTINLRTNPDLDPDYLTLANPRCKPTSRYWDRVIFRYGLMDCWTTREEQYSTMVYKNMVISRKGPRYGVITRDRHAKVPFECRLPRQLQIKNGFTVRDTADPGQTFVAYGNVSLEMKFYDSQNFWTPINQFPLFMELGHMMYIGLQLRSSDLDLKVVVDQCVATPYRTKRGPYYEVISNRCPADNTLHFYPSSLDQVRFGMQTFDFIASQAEVWLHCDVILCNSTDTSYRCDRRCHRGKRSISKSSNDETYRVYQGPIVLKGKRQQADFAAVVGEKKTNNKSTKSWSVSMPTFVAMVSVCLVAILVLMVIVVKRRRAPSGYNYRPLSSTDYY